MNMQQLATLDSLLRLYQKTLKEGKDKFNNIEDDERVAGASYFDSFPDADIALDLCYRCHEISCLMRN